MKKPVSAKTTSRPIFAFAGLGLLVLTLVASACYYYYHRVSPLSPPPSVSSWTGPPPSASATFIQSAIRSFAPLQQSIKIAPLRSKIIIAVVVVVFIAVAAGVAYCLVSYFSETPKVEQLLKQSEEAHEVVKQESTQSSEVVESVEEQHDDSGWTVVGLVIAGVVVFGTVAIYCKSKLGGKKERRTEGKPDKDPSYPNTYDSTRVTSYHNSYESPNSRESVSETKTGYPYDYEAQSGSDLDSIMNDYYANLNNSYKSADPHKPSTSKPTSSSSVPQASSKPKPKPANVAPIQIPLSAPNVNTLPTTAQAPPSVVEKKSPESVKVVAETVKPQQQAQTASTVFDVSKPLKQTKPTFYDAPKPQSSLMPKTNSGTAKSVSSNSNAKDGNFAADAYKQLGELKENLQKGQEQRAESKKVVKETTAQVEQADRELEEMMSKALEGLDQ